ncbi:hypothetical protein BBG47_27305 [Paenibacillus sp. KS1]|nr:hypothetical protein BBG47_27305 [Paenibacillus sp. KS1]
MSLDIFEGNLEKYADPLHYDDLYNNYKEDLDFIQECVEKTTHPIIELACGTGRLTIPMAKRGYAMYGVDIHQGMLNLAIEKEKASNVNIHFSKQDCTQLDLPIKSPFIFMVGNSFQHFLTNESQSALLKSVKSHLMPNGEFIFDTRNPILKELAVIDEVENTYTNANNQLVVEKHRDVYNHQTQVMHCTTIQNTLINNIDTIKKDSISLRYTYPMEIQRLLSEHDFELISMYGSWKKDSFTKDSKSMVIHCRLTFS